MKSRVASKESWSLFVQSVSTNLNTAGEKRWMKRSRVEALAVEMEAADSSHSTFCAWRRASFGSAGFKMEEKRTWLAMAARLLASVLLSTSCSADTSAGSCCRNLAAWCQAGVNSTRRSCA